MVWLSMPHWCEQLCDQVTNNRPITSLLCITARLLVASRKVSHPSANPGLPLKPSELWQLFAAYNKTDNIYH